MSARFRSRRARLGLEVLDARDVPATVVDLTSAGAQGTANGAIFQQTSPQPTGTGVIRSFVRVQGTGVEQGYNTDARPLQFDENNSPNFTRSLPVGQLPGVTVNGVSYRAFLLDINQQSSSPLLSLDELRLYVGGAGNLSGYNRATKSLAGLTPIYDLDGAGDATVRLNARLSNGSGSGDMTLLIPDSVFIGRSGKEFLYLYSNFGQTNAANAGFEEWAVRAGGVFVPPSTAPASISGRVMLTDGTGLAGVEIDLIDATGAVVRTAFTGSDGTYTFSEVVPGTYNLRQVLNAAQSLQYYSVAARIGSVNGSTEGELAGTSEIDLISLDAGDNGICYNFINGIIYDNPN